MKFTKNPDFYNKNNSNSNFNNLPKLQNNSLQFNPMSMISKPVGTKPVVSKPVGSKPVFKNFNKYFTCTPLPKSKARVVPIPFTFNTKFRKRDLQINNN